MTGERRKRPLEELQEIARERTRQALDGRAIPDTIRDRLVLGTGWEGDDVVFELYLPGPRPQDAQVLSRARIDAYTGDGGVEVFETPRLGDR